MINSNRAREITIIFPRNDSIMGVLSRCQITLEFDSSLSFKSKVALKKK